MAIGMNGYIPGIDTPEKRAAQLAQDVRHFMAVRVRYMTDCDCQACERVKVANAIISAEIKSEMEQAARDNFVATGLDRDGEATGISQPIIF